MTILDKNFVILLEQFRYDPATRNTKISGETKTELTNLRKYTNYTVQVLAFTNGGDGVMTEVLTATTEQDIPGPPSSVKALAMSGTGVSITCSSKNQSC